MKKFLLVMMAVGLTFAMISCGDDPAPTPTPTPTPDENIYVYFDLNYVGAPEPNKVAIGDDGKITLPADPTRTGYFFVGWFTERSGLTAKVTNDKEYTEDTNLYASWDRDGYVKVIFSLNYDGAEDPEIVEVPEGAKLDAEDVPDDPEWTDYFLGTPTEYVFKEWNYKADGTGTKLNVTTDEFDERTVLYAIWDLDLSGYVETVELDNAFYVVYEFTPGTGKTWADYKTGGITAQYMMTEDMINAGTARGNRLIGNIKVAHFNFSDGNAAASTGMHKAVTDFNSRNDILLNNQGADFNKYDAGTLKAGLKSYLGDDPIAKKWFTITYNFPAFPASGAPAGVAGNWDRFENLPADNNAGPWYFAVGLPGQGGLSNVFDIRKVIMKGDTEANNIVGKPAIFTADVEGTPTLFPAFAGYDTPNGTNGWGAAKRTSIGKQSITPTPVTFTIYDVALDYNWPTDDPEVTGDPPTVAADLTRKTGRTGRLSSGDLGVSKTSLIPPGYKFEGWYKSAATVDGEGISVSTVFENSTTTIYAKWRKMVLPTGGDIVYELEEDTLEIGLFGGATNYNSEEGEIPMFNNAGNTAAGRGSNDSLISVRLPRGSTELYYTKVIIEYEAWLDDGIEAGTVMNGTLKNGYNQWGDVSPAKYINFEETAADTTATIEFDFSLLTFTGTNENPGEGFSFQCNAYGDNADRWWLKIHKITIEAYVAGP